MSYFPSWSYEQAYQAVRRSWRFGQKHPVTMHYVTTEAGAGALAGLEHKAAQTERMFDSLTAHMRDALSIQRGQVYGQEVVVPAWARS